MTLRVKTVSFQCSSSVLLSGKYFCLYFSKNLWILGAGIISNRVSIVIRSPLGKNCWRFILSFFYLKKSFMDSWLATDEVFISKMERISTLRFTCFLYSII